MEEPLKEGDHGCYSELASRRVDDELVLIFMPTLAALLGHAEQLKGTSLSETEVVRIRDQAFVASWPLMYQISHNFGGSQSSSRPCR